MPPPVLPTTPQRKGSVSVSSLGLVTPNRTLRPQPQQPFHTTTPNQLLELHQHMKQQQHQAHSPNIPLVAPLSTTGYPVVTSQPAPICSCQLEGSPGDIDCPVHSSTSSSTVVVTASSSTAAPTANSSLPDTVHAANDASSNARPKDAFQRSMEYARSLTRLRSSLLSTYAMYQWLVEQFKGHQSHLAPHVPPLGELAIDSLTAAPPSMSQHITAVLNSSPSHAHSLVRSSAARMTTFHTLRRFLRTAFYLWSRYSRQFHRFLRPHLLLLVRSRALSNLLAFLAPTFKRNAFLMGHVIFVYGSAWIFIKRMTTQAAASMMTGSTPASFFASVWDTVRASAASLRMLLLLRWRSMRLSSKAMWTLSSFAGIFVLYTCYAILREHSNRRARRLQLLMSQLSPSSASLVNWSQAEELLKDELDRSPEPTPDVSPVMSPAGSYQDLTQLQRDVSNQSAEGSEGSPNLDSAATSLLPSHHAPSFSFHRDCRACIAAAIASNSNTTTGFVHNHPASPYDATPKGRSFNGNPDPSMLASPFSPRSNTLPSYPTSSAAANSLARRLESPRLPGTPASLPLHSGLSFVSPASLRLTNIRISQLKQQTESVERVQHQIQENMRLAYHQQQHPQPSQPNRVYDRSASIDYSSLASTAVASPSIVIDESTSASFDPSVTLNESSLPPPEFHHLRKSNTITRRRRTKNRTSFVMEDDETKTDEAADEELVGDAIKLNHEETPYSSTAVLKGSTLSHEVGPGSVHSQSLLPPLDSSVTHSNPSPSTRSVTSPSTSQLQLASPDDDHPTRRFFPTTIRNLFRSST